MNEYSSISFWVDVATIFGVVVGLFALSAAVRQIRLTAKINQTKFEDGLDKEYREIIAKIPMDVLIGKKINWVDSKERKQTREHIYNYLDLCNGQIYLRSIGRVSDDRWDGWRDGIEANLQKPEIQKVWKEVRGKSPSTFSFLGRSINPKSGRFRRDPRGSEV